jgi:LmbE family N-acetylglucosaminyl deacetylase
MEKVLVVMAHPDDEVLGCGGTIARMVDEGGEVQVLICGEGLTSRGGTAEAELAKLDDDLRRADSILGVAAIQHLDWPDNRFDSLSLLELIKAMEPMVLPLEPSLVITHHPGDLNVDHRYVHEAVMTCFRPLPGRFPVTILAAEIPSSTGWSAPLPERAFIPNVFSDITSTLDRKIEAMENYRTERAAWPHPRSSEAIRAQARYRGSLVGLEAAEAFVLLRQFI